MLTRLGSSLLILTFSFGTLVGTASAAPPIAHTCTGGAIPAGTYTTLTVTGSCSIPSGAVIVLASVTVAGPKALLDVHVQDGTLTVNGSILVRQGGALVYGCSGDLGCTTPPNNRVTGSIIADQPLAVILHGLTIGGTVSIRGLAGLFPGAPPYVLVEDSSVGGSILVSGVQSCWFGIIRDTVRGSVILTNNTFADPDATEIVTNKIRGSLSCFGNNPAAHVGDSGGAPNQVGGSKLGECASL
jgi:hypothetical protein